MSATSEVRRLTTSDIGRMYADNERIPMLTAYDYPTARILDEAGVPMILVGDSLGQVVLGYETTVKVTMAEIVSRRISSLDALISTVPRCSLAPAFAQSARRHRERPTPRPPGRGCGPRPRVWRAAGAHPSRPSDRRS